MKSKKFVLGGILFLLGLSGVLSLLTLEIPLSEEELNLLLEKFTLQQIEFLKLANPLMMLVVAVVLGVIFHDKVHLDVPIIKGIIGKSHNYNLSSIFKNSLGGGAVAGALIVVISAIFNALSPEEFSELGKSIQPSLASRFLYGGFTEEILMRFGLMSFFIWLLSKIFKTNHSSIYWAGILLAALIFSVAHLPVAFQSLGKPSIAMLANILIGNSIGGIIYGWLYWKKGLESAFIAHITTHVVLVIAGLFPFVSG